MQDSLDFRSLVRKYPELPYALFAIASYCISMFFALTEVGSTRDFYGVEIHIVSTLLWICFGFASIYFLYEAFFDMWIYAIHLIFAYFLTGAGFLGLYVFSDDTTIVILSLALIIMGLGFVIYFIYRVGNVRSYRIISSTDPETARERFSLQTWYLFPFIFFGISAVSFIDLGYWYENPDHTPIIHVIAEFSLIVTLVYLLWKPENILFYGTREAEDDLMEDTTEPAFSRPRTTRSSARSLTQGSAFMGEKVDSGSGRMGGITAALPRVGRGRKAENCPGFDSPPVTTRKSCPECGKVNDFSWCPQSEEYLIDCPTCDRKTYHGRKVCIHCKTRLSETVGCMSCGKESPIRRFKEVL